MFQKFSGPCPFFIKCNVLYLKNVFGATPRKTMQNHLEITSTSQFWTRSVRNWTKTLTSIMSGPTLDSKHEEKHKGTYMEHIEEIYMEYIRNIHKYL